MQKARRYPDSSGLRPLVSEQFQVLFHPPVRGTFHLSFTVLVHYRSSIRIQPYGMVPVDSDRIPRVPPYSGLQLQLIILACTWLSHSMTGFSKTVPLQIITIYASPTTPQLPKQQRFGLFPFRSPLLGESIFLSFPAGTKMFQFPALTLIFK